MTDLITTPKSTLRRNLYSLTDLITTPKFYTFTYNVCSTTPKFYTLTYNVCRCRALPAQFAYTEHLNLYMLTDLPLQVHVSSCTPAGPACRSTRVLVYSCRACRQEYKWHSRSLCSEKPGRNPCSRILAMDGSTVRQEAFTELVLSSNVRVRTPMPSPSLSLSLSLPSRQPARTR